MTVYYPPVGFHFRVEVLGIEPLAQDLRFSEVAGLSVELTTEEIAEGGENRFMQRFPGRAKYPELVLKRGLLVGSSILAWVRKCIDSLDIEPKNIDVQLLDENHEARLTWHIVNAYPTNWAVSDLNANSNTVVVESLRFSYQYFTCEEAS